MAEADGKRTRQRQNLPLNDFEDRAGHQTGYASLDHGTIMASLPVLGLAGGVTMDAVAYRMTTLNAEGASAALEGGRRMCQGHHRFRAAGTPAQGGTGQRRHRGDRLHGGALCGSPRET